MALDIRERARQEGAQAEADPAAYAAKPIKKLFKWGAVGVAVGLTSATVNFASDTYHESGKYAIENVSLNPIKATGNVAKLAVSALDETADAFGIDFWATSSGVGVGRDSGSDSEGNAINLDGLTESSVEESTNEGLVICEGLTDPEPIYQGQGPYVYNKLDDLNPKLLGRQRFIDEVIVEFADANPGINPNNIGDAEPVWPFGCEPTGN